MKILFLGSVVPPELAEKLSGTSVAGNNMQYCVVKRMAEIEDVSIDAVTVKCRAAFPKDKTLYQPREKRMLTESVEGNFAGYCNFPIVKQIWHTLSIYAEARRVIREKGRPELVMSFNMFPQTGWAMMQLKKRYQLPIVTLLADLPIDDAASRSGFMRFFRDIFDRLTKKYIAGCDNIIALNKNAVTKYNPRARCVVVDGAIDLEEGFEPMPVQQEKTSKHIVFAGALTKYNGIIQLLEAMGQVKDGCIHLDIYGDGDLRELVRTTAEKRDNITYHGRVSGGALKEIYNCAWLLINPRPVNDPISMVTFPSKTFEYLLSGTPVLSTKLSGFTSDYEDVMLFTHGDSAEAIATAIDAAAQLSREDLCKMAQTAQEFVIRKKTWKQQCAVIHRFLQEIVNA